MTNSIPAVQPDDHYDAIVIGSGPAGGTVAGRLAETGKRVLLLERGPWLPRERENWDSEQVFGKGRYTAAETFYDLHDNPFQPEMHAFVGGNSKFYGAALFRLLPQNFTGVTHPKGVTPAWPISYDDLEPYYVRAERQYWVHGEAGEDPYSGHFSSDYPFPPVTHEPRIQTLADGLESLGMHPFHMPMGVNLTERNGRADQDSACIRCDHLRGHQRHLHPLERATGLRHHPPHGYGRTAMTNHNARNWQDSRRPSADTRIDATRPLRQLRA